VIFFPEPDGKLPCKNAQKPGGCHRPNCNFSHNQTNLARFLAYLTSAKTTLDICVFNITLDEISDSVISLFQKGVKVRVITDDDQAGGQGSDVERFKVAGIPVKVDNNPAHMHNKFAVIDGHLLMTGSFNWTRQAVLQNQENVVVQDTPFLVTQFAQRFNALWNSLQPGLYPAVVNTAIHAVATKTPGICDVIFFPEPDGKLPCRNASKPGGCRRPNCQFSHAESGLTRLLGYLNSARSTLDICVFNITLDEISDTVIDIFKRGVKVRVITDDDQQSGQGSDIQRFRDLGIPVKVDHNPAHMHNKFAVIDNRVIITGSFNWTRQAVLQNQENIIIQEVPYLASQFHQRFEYLWGIYTA